ncbi:MAG: NACHT domain-containing protein [Ilumatobacter fluminis]|uniref:NACHT domain-containing protein n=1 Tax=Ilumatobacter fluminis TaxID=467091 RepID=UPI0032EEA3B7
MENVTDTMTSLATEAGRVALHEFARASVSRLVKTRSKQGSDRDKELSAAVASVLRDMDESRFGRQVAECAAWARLIHVQGMAAPVDTAATTIGIDFAPVQRRFRQAGRPENVMTESELQRSTNSVLVLGDPGSGKTTALKRLVLAMFDEIPAVPEADLSFPVVVVCREVDWARTDLCHVVAERFGVNLDRVLSTLDASSGEVLVLTAELVDQAKSLIVIDGLDEVAPKYRADLLQDIQRLHRLLSLSRVICSSRSGSAPHIEGFFTLELLPLTSEQRAEIVSRRLDDQLGFWDLVGQSGFDSQLLDRPLFLNHLVRVFEATGAIADRPSDLYGQLVRLMIHEWDEQRRVRRRSEIKGFDATTMEAVLREIAFRLTQIGWSVFTDNDLQDVMADVGEAFELGSKDSRRVLREVEAQSGFITESASGYQFAHYTLQEHLCAQNIVLRPNHRSIERLLRQNPEIAAVAVALSSNPTDWLLERIQSKTFVTGSQVAQFVDRLGQERPRFHKSDELGARLLQLMVQADTADASGWARLGKVAAAADSVERSLRSYNVEPRGESVELSVKREREDADRRRIPRYRVPHAVLEHFVHIER